MITPKEQRLLDRLHGIGRDMAKFNTDLAEHFANNGQGAIAERLAVVLEDFNITTKTPVEGNDVPPPFPHPDLA